MTLVQRACAEALTAQCVLPLTAANAESGIRNFGALRRLNAVDYREQLQQVARAHSLEGFSQEVKQALLGGRLVYEYLADGDFWYDVCPLCKGV